VLDIAYAMRWLELEAESPADPLGSPLIGMVDE
jgi:hypothetical protein